MLNSFFCSQHFVLDCYTSVPNRTGHIFLPSNRKPHKPVFHLNELILCTTGGYQESADTSESCSSSFFHHFTLTSSLYSLFLVSFFPLANYRFQFMFLYTVALLVSQFLWFVANLLLSLHPFLDLSLSLPPSPSFIFLYLLTCSSSLHFALPFHSSHLSLSLSLSLSVSLSSLFLSLLPYSDNSTSSSSSQHPIPH